MEMDFEELQIDARHHDEDRGEVDIVLMLVITTSITTRFIPSWGNRRLFSTTRFIPIRVNSATNLVATRRVRAVGWSVHCFIINGRKYGRGDEWECLNCKVTMKWAVGDTGQKVARIAEAIEQHIRNTKAHGHCMSRSISENRESPGVYTLGIIANIIDIATIRWPALLPSNGGRHCFHCWRERNYNMEALRTLAGSECTSRSQPVPRSLPALRTLAGSECRSQPCGLCQP
jgi:hypothetical protein